MHLYKRCAASLCPLHQHLPSQNNSAQVYSESGRAWATTHVAQEAAVAALKHLNFEPERSGSVLL